MTKVNIHLAISREPIQADIPNFDSKEFATALNAQTVFLELGGNVINRNLIQMITPIETTEGAQ